MAFLLAALVRGSHVAASCARQCGKNHTVIRLLVSVALGTPGASCLYVNATYNEARTIMWDKPRKSLPAVLRTLGLVEDCDYELNAGMMKVTFSNGSVVRLRGADAVDGWERVLGDELDLLVVDECQKLDDAPFVDALDRILPDLFAARRGSIVLIGTPDPFCVGEFHDICTGASRPYYSHHHWTARDLHGVTDVWDSQLRQKALENMADDDPRWLRDKLGLWVRQDDALILPLCERSLWDGQLPETVPSRDGREVRRTQEVRAYAGVDFGFTDAAAVVVGTVSAEEGVLREVHSEKRAQLNTKQLAEWLLDLRARHGIVRFYGDDAEPKTIADLSQLYRVPIVAADKLTGHAKEVWIADMRAHLLDGRLRVLDGSPLCQELRRLTPDPTAWLRRKIEPPAGSDDHCYSAFRYLFKNIWTNVVRAPEPPETEREASNRRARELREEALGLTKKRPRNLGGRY